MDDDLAVSSIELFFDLVFVFTIAQLTTLLVAEPSGVGLAKVGLIFGNVWWMYGGYAWLTNAVPPRTALQRLLMLGGMAGYLLIALAIPRAFGTSGVGFGIGYLLVTAVHTGLFLRASEEGAVRTMSRLGPFNTVTAGLLLGAGFVHGGPRWALWGLAFVFHWGSPAFTSVGDLRIRTSHFVERHGLILLIALGESVVAVGIGVQGRDLSSGFVLAALLGLAVASGFWWLYFEEDEERAERALNDAPAAQAPRLALYVFGYTYLVLLGSVVVFAAGMRQAILHYSVPATEATSWFLAAGASGYVAALAVMRIILRSGPVVVRLVVAAACVATVLVGQHASSAWQLAALCLILAAGIVTEAVGALRTHADRS